MFFCRKSCGRRPLSSKTTAAKSPILTLQNQHISPSWVLFAAFTGLPDIEVSLCAELCVCDVFLLVNSWNTQKEAYDETKGSNVTSVWKRDLDHTTAHYSSSSYLNQWWEKYSHSWESINTLLLTSQSTHRSTSSQWIVNCEFHCCHY